MYKLEGKWLILCILKLNLQNNGLVDLDSTQIMIDPSSITLTLRIPESLEEDIYQSEEEMADVQQIDSESEASEGMESDLGDFSFYKLMV